jgi:hypothetical protein
MPPNGKGIPDMTEGDENEMASAQLPLEDYRRYGRQMILEGIGLEGIQLDMAETRTEVGLNC